MPSSVEVREESPAVTAAAAPALPSVLLVDDEESILFALHDYLTAAGWRVATASSAARAEALLAAESFAAAVVDLRLSPADEDESEGLALVRRIRRSSPDTRVLLLTAYGSSRVQEEATRLGVAGFLQKPQPLARLHERLAELVGAGGAG
jgi:DNA-binding NtrC family response regulator